MPCCCATWARGGSWLTLSPAQSPHANNPSITVGEGEGEDDGEDDEEKVDEEEEDDDDDDASTSSRSETASRPFLDFKTLSLGS